VDQLKLLGIQGIKAMEDIRGLADQQAEVGQIERNLLEPEQRPALQLMALEDVGVEVERRQGHAALHPTLELEQLDMHVHRAGELRVTGLDGSQFSDLAGLGAG
jgi:hypothetical protein